MLAFIALASCGAPDGAATPSPLPAPTLAASATETATRTPVPASTPTTTPSEEPSPTQLPTVAQTATPTPAPTATPTTTPAVPPTPDGAERSARVPILMYHRVLDLVEDASAAQRDYAVSPAQFEDQLRYMKEQGFQSIRLYDLNAHLQLGSPLPDKPVIVTFDDGYRDNFAAAFPLLQKYGFTATFFINTQPIQDKYPAYMTWEQVEEMSRQGMDIESHSHSHPRLDKLPVEEILREVRSAREAIEKHTGKAIRFFSYPYGHYDQQVVDILISEGFWGAVTLRSGVAQGSRAMFDLQRVWVRYDDTLAVFAAKLKRGW